MRRIAAHFIFWKKMYRMHFLELDDCGRLLSITPLREEMAGTEFYSGLLVPVVSPPDFFSLHTFSFPYQDRQPESPVDFLEQEMVSRHISEGTELRQPVTVFRLHGLALSPSELCADNGCCNGYIERL